MQTSAHHWPDLKGHFEQNVELGNPLMLARRHYRLFMTSTQSIVRTLFKAQICALTASVNCLFLPGTGVSKLSLEIPNLGVWRTEIYSTYLILWSSLHKTQAPDTPTTPPREDIKNSPPLDHGEVLLTGGKRIGWGFLLSLLALSYWWLTESSQSS